MPLILEEKRDPLYQKGMIQGIAEGKAEGKAEGIAEGIAKGKAKGKKNGKLESAYIMVTKYALPIAKIAKDFELEESELSDYIDGRSDI